MEFDNKDRTRRYGKRVGDIVISCSSLKQFDGNAEVIDLGTSDNNRVYVKTQDGKTISCVAEWLDIVQKVEDRAQELLHKMQESYRQTQRLKRQLKEFLAKTGISRASLQ